MIERQVDVVVPPVPAGRHHADHHEKQEKGRQKHPGSVLGRSILGMVAIVLGDIAGTVLGEVLGLPERGTILCGYVVAAIVGILLVRRLGDSSILRLDGHDMLKAIDQCGWLLGINLVLGLITLMPEGGGSIRLAYGWAGSVVYIFAECVLIGITEECMFRGLLLGGLLSRLGSTRRGVIASVLLSALFFGIAHVIGSGDFTPLGLLQAALKVVQAGIIGAALALVMMDSRNLCGSMTVHALFDFLVMAPAIALGQDVDSTQYVASGAEGVATALSYVIIIIAYLPMVYLIVQRLGEIDGPDAGWLHRPVKQLSAQASAGGQGRPPAPTSLTGADGGNIAPVAAASQDGVHAGAQAAAASTPAIPMGSTPSASIGTSSLGNGQPSPHAGVFITLEGIDGCGKSTQAKILADRLRASGREVVSLRDPGSTEISEKIRAILLDPANDGMADDCELLLYEAARAQMAREAIEPALARGAVVICDRFFDSTYAYQHGGRGLDEGLVRTANALGSCEIIPDRTLVFDLPAEHALRRATQGGADRLEGEGTLFEERVRNAYLRLALSEPDRVRVIDAAGTVDEVAARTAEALKDLLPGVQDGR